MTEPVDRASQSVQVLLRLEYQRRLHERQPMPRFSDVEFHAFSQNGEDGILLLLFSVLGTVNRVAVEICAGSGIECNAANLVINHGWRALMVDGDPDQIATGTKFYREHRNTRYSPPTLVSAWLTAESLNDLVRKHGFAGEIDLFSLDVDGNDYWFWRALDAVQPRVVVVEFNALLGPERALTMPYDAQYRFDPNDQPPQCGASLSAFAKLGREKGYRLVGVHSLGFNAFFVRDGLGEEAFPEVTPAQCFAQVERLRDFSPAWLDAMYRNARKWQEV